MPIEVKICGLTSLADARYCAGAGADYLGFVFHEASPRNVVPAVVKEIAEWLHGPEIVGVFVDRSPDDVNAIAAEAGLTMAQLHGDESPEACEEIDLPVIKAFRVRESDTATSLAERFDAYAGAVRAFLLDTYHPDQPGGTGTSFDWSIAAELASEYPIILSGGINAANVSKAVRSVLPLAVDLSSSVESAPGVKDFDLLSIFFDAFESLRRENPAYLPETT